MTTDAQPGRRVIDPSTEYELVRSGTEDGPRGRRCDIVGLRCAVCEAEAPLGEEIDHAEGCEQADVELAIR